jgi:arginase
MSAIQNKFLKDKSVSVIGVPFNGGQPRTGVEDGPIRLVEFGLLNQLQEMGYKVDYEANESIHSLRPAEDPDVLNLKQPKYVSAVTEHVSKQIYQSAKEGKFVLTLGGDHSVALATVSGVFSAYPEACLIWVDAHAVSCINF